LQLRFDQMFLRVKIPREFSRDLTLGYRKKKKKKKREKERTLNNSCFDNGAVCECRSNDCKIAIQSERNYVCRGCPRSLASESDARGHSIFSIGELANSRTDELPGRYKRKKKEQ